MSKYGIEDTHFLLMDIYAMRHTNSRRSEDDRTPLGLLITDDDRRAGIREFFQPEALDDDLVDLVLDELKQFNKLQEEVRRFCDAVIGSMGFGAMLRGNNY